MRDEVEALERALADPAVRGDRAQVEALLHSKFREFGSSGRVWNRAEIIDLLAAEPPGEIVVENVEVRAVAEGVALVTYTSRRGSGGRPILRSSLWVRAEGRWQIVFHQGTPAAV
jgi:hypothetical protein